MSRTSDTERLIISNVLGLADASERNDFTQQLEHSAEFRAQVQEIEAWLAPLAKQASSVSPPEALFDRILSDITSETDNVVPMIAPQKSNRFWPGLAIAASLVAMAAIGSHFISRPDAPVMTAQQDYLLSVLAASDTREVAVLIYDPKTKQIIAHFENFEKPSDKDLELWVIREGAAAPESLGVVSISGPDDNFRIRPETEFGSNADVLAISLEPLGGSGELGPRGPILATGKISMEFRG